MSEAESTVTDSSALSFERAEFQEQAPPALACGFCGNTIKDQYWQITKRPACAACKVELERQIANSNSSERFFGALRLGGLAAVAGSVGWVVISKVTGYEIGIVAVGIGYLVGKAVRKGAGGFGGTRYQVMAMLLTYSAIAFASLPAIFEAIRSSPKHAAATAAAAAPIGIGGMLWAWVVLLGFAFASPFLSGMQNIMGLIIIGIGLYEAWKFTRALPIRVLGPFALTPAQMPPALALDAAAD